MSRDNLTTIILKAEEVKIMKQFLFAHLNNKTKLFIPIPEEWRDKIESIYYTLLLEDK